MFNQVMLVQWKWARHVLVPAILVGFALPILSVQGWTDDAMARRSVGFLIEELQMWGFTYPLLAAALGLTLAWTAWGQDHRLDHVYALALPVPRWFYVTLKLGAGLLFLIPAALAVWVGGVLAVNAAAIPPGVETYPGALAMRYLLAAMIAFLFFFAISASTNKTAGYVLGAIAGLLVTQVLLEFFDVDLNVVELVGRRILLWPGPLEIFSGRWVLIDV